MIYWGYGMGYLSLHLNDYDKAVCHGNLSDISDVHSNGDSNPYFISALKLKQIHWLFNLILFTLTNHGRLPISCADDYYLKSGRLPGTILTHINPLKLPLSNCFI